ncbi:hypothetical protein [Sedimentibacter sp.]|uniref:carbohydrate ABC transporter permease n=1 Tax=Sedimentibacter sp. TaxID=1960295 RepID=UPI0028A75D52|nr:hypothetical protein [Sedimentibacter sp.]
MKKYGMMKYILPSVLGVASLYLVPFIIAQKYVFFSSNNSFTDIFSNLGFIISIKNTAVFMSVFIPLAVIIGFVTAFATEYLRLSFWVQAAVILPITVPASSVSGFFREIAASSFLENVNGLFIVGFIFLWSCIGYTYIIFLISLKNRDKSIEEAAYLDGSGTFRTIFSIMLPLHSEALVLAVIVSTYNSLKIFRMTYAIFGEYPDYRMFMIQNFLHLKLKELSLDTLMVGADILLAFIFVLLFFILRSGQKHKRKMSL